MQLTGNIFATSALMINGTAINDNISLLALLEGNRKQDEPVIWKS